MQETVWPRHLRTTAVARKPDQQHHQSGTGTIVWKEIIRINKIFFFIRKSGITPVLAVQPDHVSKGGCKTEGNEKCWHVPFPGEILQHGRKDEPKTDGNKHHAGHYLWIRKSLINQLEIHDVQIEL